MVTEPDASGHLYCPAEQRQARQLHRAAAGRIHEMRRLLQPRSTVRVATDAVVSCARSGGLSPRV